MPVDPSPTPWTLPDITDLPDELSGEDLVGIGADLEPGTLLAGYRGGLFPMHVTFASDDTVERVLGWWSPDPRAILPLESLVVSRSLRASTRRLRTTVDEAFEAVVDGCATGRDDGHWITDDIRAAYVRLHRMGWAHSVETWSGDELVGGLYGVSIGGLFAGESMFHRATDASKVALVRLVEELGADGVDRLLDVQWRTDHLASLGAEEIPRQAYWELLQGALGQPLPPVWGDR